MIRKENRAAEATANPTYQKNTHKNLGISAAALSRVELKLVAPPTGELNDV